MQISASLVNNGVETKVSTDKLVRAKDARKKERFQKDADPLIRLD